MLLTVPPWRSTKKASESQAAEPQMRKGSEGLRSGHMDSKDICPSTCATKRDGSGLRDRYRMVLIPKIYPYRYEKSEKMHKYYKTELKTYRDWSTE